MSTLNNNKKSVSKVIAKLLLCASISAWEEEGVYDSSFFTLTQILELSALDLLFMLFSDVMQPIFFVNEFFATLIAFCNWVMVDLPCMTY